VGALFFVDVCLFALAVLPGLGGRGFSQRLSEDVGRRVSGIAFCSTVVLLLLLCRAPWILIGREFNPDESSFLAQAARYSLDIVPWRPTHSGTSGPLTPYLLAALAAVGMPLSYATAHVATLVIQCLVLIISYRALRIMFSDLAARLAIVPAAVWMAHTADNDFIHYSSEHVPLLLLSGATLAAALAIYGHRPRWLWLFVSGLAAGAVSFAKLQAVPMALVCSSATLVAAWFTSPSMRQGARDFASYSAGAITLPVVMLVMIVSGGVWTDFIQEYFVENLAYGFNHATALTWWDRFEEDFAFVISTYPYAAMAMQAVACLSIAVWSMLAGRMPEAIAKVTAFQVFCTVAYGLAALYGILRPGMNFPHYLLLFLPPFMMATAVAVEASLRSKPADGRPSQPWAAFLVVFASAGCALGLAAVHNSFPYHEPKADVEAWLIANSIGKSEEATAVESFTKPGDEIAVWGFRPDIYVEAGRRPAVRDCETSTAIKPGPFQASYRDRFLQDMQRTPPAMFVDAVCHAGWLTFLPSRGHPLTDIAHGGHETFPALRELVNSNYFLRTVVNYDAGVIRIFERRSDGQPQPR